MAAKQDVPHRTTEKRDEKKTPIKRSRDASGSNQQSERKTEQVSSAAPQVEQPGEGGGEGTWLRGRDL